MSELMLHVVANAIRGAMNGMRPEVLVEMAGDEGPTDLTPFCILAEAAIEAMREPTDAMVEKFYDVPEAAVENWRAMIDAALAEKV